MAAGMAAATAAIMAAATAAAMGAETAAAMAPMAEKAGVAAIPAGVDPSRTTGTGPVHQDLSALEETGCRVEASPWV
jgi:hypothetical protein